MWKKRVTLICVLAQQMLKMLFCIPKIFFFRIMFLEGVTHFYNEFIKTQAPKQNSIVSIFNFVAIYHILNNMTEPFGQRERDPKCIKWMIKFRPFLPYGKISSK